MPRSGALGYHDRRGHDPPHPDRHHPVLGHRHRADRHDAEGVLELRPDLEPGLTDIEGFSHLCVLWVFDRADGFDLIAHPPLNDRPHGVFATRSPRRPNPIGLTVVRLLRRDGSRLYVRGVDMLDGSPIVDLKPYLSSVPEAEIRRGWLAEAEARGGRPEGP
jgi:tRNA-Thr(GGU) m(6)t(6)A37 methyltransferase TsaA